MASKGREDRDDLEDDDDVEEHRVTVDQTPEPAHLAHIGNCRFYENKFPEVDDLVMVEVKSIEQMGAYVALKEYNDIEGMILLSELSRRRIRSINKIIRVGRMEVVVVLRVDKEKGYVDLSKRRVSPEDVTKCEEKYNKSKKVHTIMRHVAETSHRELIDLYTLFCWPLYRKYGHAFDAFQLSINDQSIVDSLEIPEEIKHALSKNIRRMLTPKAEKIRADIEVTCYKPEGIDAIVAALRKGRDLSTDEVPIKIKLIAPPLYVLVTTSMNKEGGIALLTKAIEAIKEEIIKRKGEINVKAPPRAVLERDEKELSSLLEKLEKENQEVPADDDASEEED